MTTRDKCPVCESTRVMSFLSRRNVPVHQNLLMKDRYSALAINRGDLILRVCEECGFIYNGEFDSSKLNYGEDYDNTQTYSDYFEEYTDNIVWDLIHNKGVKNCKIVEVGCGKGGFLRKLVEDESTGNIGYGFDPSYIGELTDLNNRLIFHRRFFGTDCNDIQADIVICRHVIEHIDRPVELICAIKQSLENSPHGKVFFETPCVEWILRNKVFYDFFYEHCSYFTSSSLTTAFEMAGFQVNEVRHLFGGQYLWLEAEKKHSISSISKYPLEIKKLSKEYKDEEERIKNFWYNKLIGINKKGKISIWGAGAKGVTFANLIDPECKFIDCIIDLNPEKQGKYLPGTGHDIISYKDINKRDIKFAILMNKNYLEENMNILGNLNINLEFISDEVVESKNEDNN